MSRHNPGCCEGHQNRCFDGPRGYGKAHCMFPPHLAEKLRTLSNNLFRRSLNATRRSVTSWLPWSRRHAPGMAAELREDVLQEALLYLVGSGQGTYDGMANTGPGCLYTVVRSALQSVRRRYGILTQNSRLLNRSISIQLRVRAMLRGDSSQPY